MGIFGKSSKKEDKNVTPPPPVYVYAAPATATPDEDVIKGYLWDILETEPELIIVVSSLRLDIVKIVSHISKLFPGTDVVGLKIRGLIATNQHLVPKSGIGILSFSKELFKASVYIPESSKEHEILEGIPKAIRHLSEIATDITPKFPKILNIAYWDSFQNGHQILNIYEREIDTVGLFNTPLTGVILHPDNNLKQTYLVYGKGNNVRKIINGFIFISLFTRLHIKSSISLGLHPLIPFKITDAEGNVLLKLNDKPAFIAYKEYIMKKGIAEEEFTHNLPFIFATYQFGFPNLRNPRNPEIRIALKHTKDNGLVFNGEIPKESTIWVMHADIPKMIEATATITKESVKGNIKGGFVFSSIFRLIRMKNEYIKEINHIKGAFQNTPFLLFNTYLEIYYKNQKEAFSNSTSNLVNIFYE